MMIRGESFRSDFRVPTHMAHAMTNAQSVDRLVQSSGRATFLGKVRLSAALGGSADSARARRREACTRGAGVSGEERVQRRAGGFFSADAPADALLSGPSPREQSAACPPVRLSACPPSRGPRRRC